MLQRLNKNETASEEEAELMFLQHNGSQRRRPSRQTRSRACLLVVQMRFLAPRMPMRRDLRRLFWWKPCRQTQGCERNSQTRAQESHGEEKSSTQHPGVCPKLRVPQTPLPLPTSPGHVALYSIRSGFMIASPTGSINISNIRSLAHSRAEARFPAYPARSCS